LALLQLYPKKPEEEKKALPLVSKILDVLPPSEDKYLNGKFVILPPTRPDEETLHRVVGPELTAHRYAAVHRVECEAKKQYDAFYWDPARLPALSLEKRYFVQNMDEYVAELYVTNLDDATKFVREAKKAREEKEKKSHDAYHVALDFKKGDVVWRQTTRPRVGGSSWEVRNPVGETISSDQST